jgi:hypothetical protein
VAAAELAVHLLRRRRHRLQILELHFDFLLLLAMPILFGLVIFVPQMRVSARSWPRNFVQLVLAVILFAPQVLYQPFSSVRLLP